MNAAAPQPYNAPPSGARATGQSRFPRPSKPYPHIRDLVARAELEVDANATLRKLFERAANALKQAQTSLDFKRPDHAYTEYLIAYIIAVQVLPRHKDAPSLDPQDLRSLIHRINSNQSKYEDAKQAIVEDNQTCQTQPKLFGRSDDRPHDRGLQVRLERRPASVQLPQNSDPHNHPSSQYSSPRIDPVESHSNGGEFHSPRSSRGVEGDIWSSSVSASDVLAERFSRLRTTGPSASHKQLTAEALSNSSKHRNQVPQPKSTYPASQGFSKELPKPPSPTYSPSRGSAPPVNATTKVVRSTISSPSERPSSSASSVSSVYPSTVATTISYSASNETLVPSKPLEHRKRRSLNAPRETELQAERLFDYLKTFRILIIDVRSREDYDLGHIWAQHSMCVDPVSLRPDMSASQLREALVLSPENEQEMFDRRDEFDLVVFHDQSATSRNSKSEDGSGFMPLQSLYDALYEFNDKPLRFPPALLVGGLDAWSSLVGLHALATSNTMSLKLMAARSIPQKPSASPSSRLQIQKNRHRDYNPLNPEEERRWRAKARSAVVEQQPEIRASDLPSTPEISDGSFPSPSQDVLNRFPDVASVEERTFVSNVPKRPPPEPPKTPLYPTPPTPSVPSRPPPALPRKSYSGVSERLASPTVSSTKSQLAVYIPPRLTLVPRIGLHNFGVTCYMNATIQCLSATIDLTTFFLDGQWSRDLQENNWKGSKGIIPHFYYVLLRNLWLSKDVDTIRPTNFRKFCARLNKEWGLDRQQDAKEFLEFLIDCLHEDFNVNWARTPVRPLTSEEEARRERMPQFLASKREWERYLHRDHSYITELFAGQHISRLQCTTCHFSSTTYEPFYSVSVEIPTPASEQQGVVDIRDCLRSYCSDERLSGDEVWRCPRCNKEREAIKRITISRAPRCLVIHFKRFSAGHSERARKIHTPVKFPLKGFDLGPFMLPPPNKDVRGQLSAQHPQHDLASPWSMTPPYKYDAYAIMRHIGNTLMSGHYTSLVRDSARGCWREFNDDRVEDFQPENLTPSRGLQNEQAYIVFYRRTV